MKITLAIEGMSCSACSSAIEHYLSKQKGILNVSVNLVMANAAIEYDEQILSQKRIEQFISEAGYKSKGIYKPENNENDLRFKKINLICFSVLAAFLLYVSMGHMIGLPFFKVFSKPLNFSILILCLTLPFLVYGADIFYRGIKNLFRLRPNMDSLVFVGVLSSFCYSLFAFIMIIKGNNGYMGELYFESCAIIVFFVKLGKFLEFKSKVKTKSAIMDLVQITPSKAYKKEGDKITQVDIDQVCVGDILVCRAGEKIAVDGTITFGEAHFDESFITGESKHPSKGVEEKVVAGSFNFDGYIEYRAEKIGKNSTISQIVDLVVKASSSKMPISKVADRVSLYFVPVVMGLALLTFIVYLILGFSFGVSIITFVTILVVACPCSLGLGTPVATVISEGICAKNGILVKKSESLEMASKIDTIVFDKTGTLTYGELKISDEKIINGDRQQAYRLACSLESVSSHPIAVAFKKYALENNIELYDIENFENLSGLGIAANISGKKVLVGNRKLIEKYGIAVEENIESEFEKKGESIVFLAEGESVLAVFGVSDAIKDNANKMIEKLKNRHIKTIMLTGDNKEAAKLVAEKVGIDEVIAEVMPSEKADVISRLRAEGHKVAMVGDGINDSPALTIADIGMSVHRGSDIAINSASVVFMTDDLDKIDKFFDAAKKTIINIKQNLFWAFFYNTLMIPIAMGIFRKWFTISPMLAAISMVLSSLSVVLNALRLNYILEDKNGKKRKNNNKN